MKLIDLPDEVLETVLSNLTYDEIARNRVVCKRFDRIGRTLLNRGFNAMEKYHANCVRAVKSQLPRRESERRVHPLARHCDILAAIETRISMLSMTFHKYIDLNLCCFIPGKVIDEIFRVLRLIRVSKSRNQDAKPPPRAHEILQELRDISSMAMEHFDEKILPDLKHNLCSSLVGNLAGSYDLPSSSFIISRHSTSAASSSLPHTFTSEKLKQTFKKIYSRTRKNKGGLLAMNKRIVKMNLRLKRQSSHIKDQNLRMQEQDNKLQAQEKQLAEMKKQETKLQAQDQQLAEMRKLLEEFEQKVDDLTAKVSRAQDESDVERNTKRKHRDFIKKPDGVEPKTKKRKLIIDRQLTLDPQSAKFKKFMTNLLGNTSLDDALSSH